MRERKLTTLLVTLTLFAVACSGSSQTTTTTAAGTDYLESIGQVAVGEAGAVVSVDGLATQVGIDVLQDGGNAMDAAIAVGFALAVTHPAAGNLGGGGFMTVYVADEDRYTTFDFREKAPGAATADMYLGDDGRPVRGINRVGWLAPGVPGTVAGFGLVHEELGRLPWERLVEPARRLADEGFLLNPYLARSLASAARSFEPFPASRAAFLKPDGTPHAEGERLRQPDLAWTLERIRDGGADAFYKGEIAERLAAAMETNGGLITMEDLAAYEAKEREPIRGTYRDYEVISMGPPSSGGVALVEMLNILETFDMTGLESNDAQSVHLMVEAMRQAYMDRAAHLGDMDFIDVPIERLTSKEYAGERAAEIIADRARSSAELGEAIIVEPESMETTHYSVVDGDGNVVSITYTIEAGYGAKAMAPGTGFLLNNEMSDFNGWPGITAGGFIGTDANLIASGKRMLSSMTPTILARAGKPVMAVGSPGGKTIINTVLRVIVNVVDFEMGLAEAVAAPRIHHQWLPDRVTLGRGFPQEVADTLAGMGHQVTIRGTQGDAHSIFILPGGARLAVADPRRSGAAGAY